MNEKIREDGVNDAGTSSRVKFRFLLFTVLLFIYSLTEESRD